MTPISLALYLSQAYQDAQADYVRALTCPTFPCWDYIILTASDENQAEGYRAQLRIRELPPRTHFAVIADEGGQRVGSGGATLSVIRYIENHGGLDGKKILVIHSGGDSKRVPQYSALGKLFSPVPHELTGGRSSTLFDEFMIAMSSVPSRLGAGMMLLSGDVLLLFNSLLIDYSGRDAAVISFNESVQTGKDHGVYLAGSDGNVRRFLHKQSVETLTALGAVNENGNVSIDTGAIILSTDMVKALYSLIDTDEKYHRLVNPTVRLSLYGDFQYPLAEDSTLEDFYNEQPEGSFCDELTEARTLVWNTLRPYRMKLLRLAPAKFIHFGTSREILELMSSGIDAYYELGWRKHINSSFTGNTAGYNSVLSSKAAIGTGCYLETSYVHSDASVGDGCILSYIDIHNETIPSNVVLHGLKQKDGKFVCRIYGVNDNPKENSLFGCDLSACGLEDLWENTDPKLLWTAKLYPVCDTVAEAVSAALNLYELLHNGGDLSAWKNAPRKSLCAGFRDADPEAIIAWDKRMAELVQMDKLSKLIAQKIPATEAVGMLKAPLTPIQVQWLEGRLQKVNYSEAIRLHYYVGTAMGGLSGDKEISQCFREIRTAILSATKAGLKENKTARIVSDRHEVRLPLRVNWGGGWSDTPPHCNENGGTVLNAAIKLNGEFPVCVTLERIDAQKIIFDSRDMDVHGEFDDITALQSTGDPFDPFALQKAALLSCGIIPAQGGSLEEILPRLGGGFIMHSEVTGVPKGSGLGTSSILSAACVKCLFEFFGIPYTLDALYAHVLAMEQLMSTGGGWQDQVGGLSGGIKYITSRPGINQTLKVDHVTLDPSVAQQLQERFCLIYTGQRRLARNLLRDVVGRYVGNEPESLYALNEIQRLAVLMRFELERGNVDEFAKLLDRHWELSKQIDRGSTNTLIDQIFHSIRDLIDAKMICGAGGGGFLQVIMKKGVCREDVHKRLKQAFSDSTIDVWDCELV
ncbi:MAG: bifunctional fucokinase/L-fucose-1-P-guanylyltransferase [Oscillospiraceae bacterium]|nr:bifunctional fucokinase/L-fucose-1-P-guanylyltransferase [Oscillospiraceae bacterium]